jgi:hypothetical protein
MSDPWFSIFSLLLVIWVAFDVFSGKEIRQRKWLQGGVVVLFLIVLISIPRCGSVSEDTPDGQDIPYSF